MDTKRDPAPAPPKSPRGKQFEKGNAGRPKGALNKSTRAAEALLEGQFEGLIQKLFELASEGNMEAMKLILGRIPVSRDRRVTFDIRPIKSLEDARLAFTDVFAALAAGDITPLEAETVCRALTQAVRAFESNEIMDDLADLDRKVSNAK